MVRPIKGTGGAFAPVRRASVVDAIIDRIKAILRTGRGGTELPHERELARRLGVSRHSVREALRTLARLGVLEIRHGRGTRLAKSSSRLLKTPLELLVAMDRPSMEELLETRRVIEEQLAGWAAERRTGADLAELDAAFREMRENVSDPEASTAADVRFHEAVAAAAHNRLFQRFVGGLHDPMTAFIRAVRPGVTDHRRSLQRHAKLLEAIRKRDARAARRLTSATMAETGRELRRVWRKKSGRRR